MKEKLTTIIIGTLAFISIIIQVTLFNGFDKECFQSLNINLLAGIISVFITYKAIDQLLKKYEEKRKILFINETVKNEYLTILNNISQLYISYVTKKPPTLTREVDTFDKVVSNLLKDIEKYVDGNFLKNDIIVIEPKPKGNWIISENKNYSYQKFCELTKITIKNTTNEFLIKYNSLIPGEVIVNLSSINNCFMKPIFTTGLERGIQLDLSNAQFEPIHFIKPLKEIGNHILGLYKVI